MASSIFTARVHRAVSVLRTVLVRRIVAYVVDLKDLQVRTVHVEMRRSDQNRSTFGASPQLHLRTP
ncbi:MAG TPA: hypothetical protein VK550_28270 [Polyangiaceae bacterium]|nr:hypothetical protein [Polyangiaceae bacterium]